MNNNLFWNNWSKQYRIFYLIMLTTAMVSLAGYIFFYFYGGAFAINWETNTLAEKIMIPIDQFRSGMFNFTVEADNYLIIKNFRGGLLKIHPQITYLFLTITWACVMVFLAAATTLNRFWYFIAIVLFAFILVNFQFGHLKVFGRFDNTFLIITLASYLPVSYLFHAIYKNSSFIRRWTVFVAISILLAVFLYFFAQVKHPFYYLAVYSIATPVILTVLFILIVSYQVILGFLYVLTRAVAGSGKNNTIHFLIISLFYLIYLAITFLHQAAIIDWNLIYLDPFILIIISAVIGIWGFRERSTLFANSLSFYPSGGYAYLAGFIICFTTITYFIATANDPIVETFEDAITFSHLGFGFAFLLYVMANFFTPMMQNLKVHKVVYSPKYMPYFTLSLVGIIASAGFYFYTNKISYRQAISGYYNGIGDLYKIENEPFTAEQYYKLGLTYGYGNHRSAYSLASLAQQLNASDIAIFYYNEAQKKHPSAQGFVNIAELYRENGKFFDALFTLKKGLQEFPNNGQILNNLALMYGRTQILDSAFIFLENATRNQQSNEEANVNIYYLLAKHKINLDLDSVAAVCKSESSSIVKSNMLAYLNLFGYKVEVPEPKTSTSLDWNNFIQVNNYVYNNINETDSSFLVKFTSDTTNLLFMEALDKAKAFASYYSGNKTKAFLIGDQLQVNAPSNAAAYNNHLGIWAMDQETPRLAYDFFSKAESLEYPSAATNKLIALTEAGQISEALEGWRIQSNVDSASGNLANIMVHLLEADSSYFSGEQLANYYYQRLRIKLIQNSLSQIPYYYEQLKGTSLEALAIHDVTRYYANKADFLDAIEWFEKASGLEIADYKVQTKLNKLRLLLMSKLKSFDALTNALADEQVRKSFSAYELMYYEALLNQNEGKKAEALSKLRMVAAVDPFFEEAVIYASEFIRQNSNDDMEAYRLLYNAMQINKYSLAIKKAYVLQSLKARLPQYAADVLNEISQDMTIDEYEKFRTEYDSLEQELLKHAENW